MVACHLKNGYLISTLNMIFLICRTRA